MQAMPTEDQIPACQHDGWLPALLPRLTPEQAEILGHISIVYLDDGQGGQAKTIRLTGVNVQVVNGLDDTTATNGLGNLIVGYHEEPVRRNDVMGSSW